jgi:FkbM family methyltransferase
MLTKRVSNFIDNSSTVGLQNTLSLFWNFTLFRKEKCPILFPGCSHPLYLRESTSDFILLKQFLPLFRNWQPKHHPPQVVIDAGANIGLFTVMMANRYPQALIIAIEPDEENFELLRDNCKPYRNVELVKAALWYKQEPLVLANPEADHWARQVESSQKGASNLVDAVTVSSVLEDFKIQHIDIFKIDIEGAEAQILQHGDLSWVSTVRELLMELHERSDLDIKQLLFNALSAHSYTKEELGEYLWLSFS